MYKLINKQTGEEHICQKVVIDGMDYYVSDEKPKLNDAVITAVGNIHYIKEDAKDFIEYVSKLGKKVIATNNSNIYIPKIVYEVGDLFKVGNRLKITTLYKLDESTGFQTYEGVVVKNRDGLSFNSDDGKKFKLQGTYWFGSLLDQKIELIYESQETYPFSEEDMIDFSQWVSKYDWVFMSDKDHWVNDDLSLHPKTTKELLQLWKEQQTKTVYYE